MPEFVKVAGSTEVAEGDLAAYAARAIGVGVASDRYSEDDLREVGADYVLGSLEEDLPGTAEAVGVRRGGQPSVVPRGVNSSQVPDPRIGPRTSLHPPTASRGNMYLQWSHRTAGVGAGR